MSKKIRLLDCTLRDGAYIVNANFGATAIKGIIDKMQVAGVDIIECGWLKNDEHKCGTSFYHIPSDATQYINHKNNNTTYVAMIDWDRYDLSYLPQCDGNSIDAIRIVFPYGKAQECVSIAKKIKEKGYEVYLQAANTLAYNDNDLIDLAKTVNEINPVSLSVVDTFGAMYEEDLERIVKTLDKQLNPEIKMGFHSHNNQQLSFALTMHFVNVLSKCDREIVIDASLCGMGRGAGNATTELVSSYLNRKWGSHYDLDAIMDAIDIYMQDYLNNYSWGYSTPFFIAGLYCSHVNNIAYLINNHRVSAKDMRNIIESLSPEDRKKYDYDLLEQKYIENQSRHIDDTFAIDSLKAELNNKPILLIAPGKSAVNEDNKIKKFIKENNPIVIGVNAALDNYDYDYLFFVNSNRYDYAHNAHPKKLEKAKNIILSNIKSEGTPNEIFIDFESTIQGGWLHFDNAVICCLNLMERLQLTDVSIAGFDGFKTVYNESYADELLPSLNLDNKWDELNEEIKEMTDHFRKNARYATNINFITESIFE